MAHELPGIEAGGGIGVHRPAKERYSRVARYGGMEYDSQTKVFRYTPVGGVAKLCSMTSDHTVSSRSRSNREQNAREE